MASDLKTNGFWYSHQQMDEQIQHTKCSKYDSIIKVIRVWRSFWVPQLLIYFCWLYFASISYNIIQLNIVEVNKFDCILQGATVINFSIQSDLCREKYAWKIAKSSIRQTAVLPFLKPYRRILTPLFCDADSALLIN